MGKKKGRKIPPPPPPIIVPNNEPVDEEEEFADVLVPLDTIMLFSSDGFIFTCEKDVALISQKVREMVFGGGNFKEETTRKFHFSNINGKLLEKVIEYWHYRHQHSNYFELLPEFKIDPKIAVDLLIVADFLDT